MNKVQIIESMAVAADIGYADAERVLESVICRVIEAVSANEQVRIGGLGSFSQSVRSARIGRNPATGAPLKIAASKSIQFRAGEAFKRQINQP